MYKIKGVDISEILESPANRESSDLGLKEFNVGSAPITYAAYNPLYHPFTIDTGLSNYYVNSNTQNKGFVPKGYAPLTIPRYICDFIGEKPEKYEHHYIKMIDNHKVEIGIQYTDSYSPIKTIDVPETFILCVQGSGGGGAGGTKYDNAMGGGCGAALVLNVKYTPGITIFMELGSGGKGGAPGKSGHYGEETVVYCGSGDKSFANRIAYIYGGHSGYISSSEQPTYAPITVPTTDKKYCAFSECDILDKNLRMYGYATAEGKYPVLNAKYVLAISKSVQNYKPLIWDQYNSTYLEGPVFNYIPGCYYGAYNKGLIQNYLWESFVQTDRNLLPVVTSGDSVVYNRFPVAGDPTSSVISAGKILYNYKLSGSSFKGVDSILGKGGQWGNSVTFIAFATYADGQKGSSGIRGSGGGAGGHGYIAWGKDAEGGDGGNASFAIYF